MNPATILHKIVNFLPVSDTVKAELNAEVDDFFPTAVYDEEETPDPVKDTLNE